MPAQQRALVPPTLPPSTAPPLTGAAYTAAGQFRNPTTAHLLDLTGIGQRQATWTFDVLDETLATIGTVMPESSQPAKITLDTTRTVMRTLESLVLPPGILTSINPYRDRIKPFMQLENGASQGLGVFLYADAQNNVASFGNVLTAALVDQTILLDQPTAAPTVARAGTVIADLIGGLLAATPVGVNYQIDRTGTTVAGDDMAWPAGTSLLAVINALGFVAGCQPLYFDRDGTANVRVAPNYSYADPDLFYDDGRFYTGSGTTNIGLLSAPNRYITIDTGPTDSPIVGVWDVPASAPNSAPNRGGFVQAKTIPSQGLGTVAAANLAAMVYGQSDQAAYGKGQFSGPPDSRHDVNNVVSWLDVVYLELGWSMTCQEGADMTHTLKTIYPGA